MTQVTTSIHMEGLMPKYIIEREIPGAAGLFAKESRSASTAGAAGSR